MNDKYIIDDYEYQDTIPDAFDQEETDIYEDDTIDTPDSEDQYSENVERDAENLDVQQSASEKPETNEPFISVQYNHKNRDFTKQEAINFIQKGMHTEALRTKLEYLAKKQGTDVNSIVERIVMAPENEYRRHLEEMYGKDSPDVEIGMAIYRERQSDDYKKMMGEHENSVREQKNTESINTRLANEYMTLKSEMPDAPDYSELPNSVIMDAAKGNRDLYSAYLHYLNKERMKIDAANKTSEAANAASLGKMSTNDGGNMNSTDRKFLSGLWQK